MQLPSIPQFESLLYAHARAYSSRPSAYPYPVKPMPPPLPEYARDGQDIVQLFNDLAVLEKRREGYTNASVNEGIHFDKDLAEPSDAASYEEKRKYLISLYSRKEAHTFLTKNRYANMHPYEAFAVRPTLFARRGGARYLNMSYVPSLTDGRPFYAAQAPKLEPNTVHTFLSAIIQDGVKVVAQLTELKEDGKVKAETWFPEQTQCEDEEPKIFNDPDSAVALGVTTMRVQELAKLGITIRHLKIQAYKYTENGRVLNETPAHFITHFWYHRWKDMATPDNTDEILALLKHMHKANLEPRASLPEDANPDPPMVLYCSAGVGRTGSLILSQSCLVAAGAEGIPRYKMHPSDAKRRTSPKCFTQDIRDDPVCNKYKDNFMACALDYIRHFRPGLVQKAEQLNFVPSVVRAGIAATA